MENFIKQITKSTWIDEKIVASIYKEWFIHWNEQISWTWKRIIRNKLDNIIYKN